MGLALRLLGDLARRLGTLERSVGEGLDRLLGLDHDRDGAAVGLDEQLGLDGLAAGADQLGADVNGNLRFVSEVEVLLAGVGIAQGEPDGVAGHGAVHQPHALVFHLQVEGARLVGVDRAQVHVERFDAQLGIAQHGAGQLGQQLIQSAFGVRKPAGFLGGQGQIDPAQAAEEAFEVAVLEQSAGGAPLFLTGEGQFVEAAASASGGKNEGTGEGLGPDRHGTAAPLVPAQDEAVVVAIDGLGRVGAGALRAKLSHDSILRQKSEVSESGCQGQKEDPGRSGLLP